MCHNEDMKTVSIRELHMRTGALVQEAADGELIIIENRGVPVAELAPLTAAEVFRERERSGYFKKLPKTKGELSRFISEDRIR
jgi:antitoxin (DNA-binding transcriptional repressor) of toxin-antitoxin stability system